MPTQETKVNWINVVWDYGLNKWYFNLGTHEGGHIAFGLSDSHLYFDDPDDILLGAAKTWIQKIAPGSTGYEIRVVRPPSPAQGWGISDQLKMLFPKS